MRAVACLVAFLACGLAPMPRLAAESGSPNDLNNAGVEAAKAGNLERGVALLRDARRMAPNDDLYRRNLSGMLTDWGEQLARQGRLDQAVAAFREAMEHLPENPVALVKLADLLYLTKGQFDEAVRLWERAHPHLDDQAQRRAVTQRISQAKRDSLIERTYSSLPTTHFRIKYDAVHVDQASELARVLEAAYGRLAETLDVTIPPITVILYTGQDFQRLSGQRDSTFGLYDGRIRVRLDEIGSQYTPQILSHELAHAFLATAFGPAVPTWVHEGFAQTQEPELPLTPSQQAALAAIKSRTAWVPLKWLDRRFVQPSGSDDLEKAYLQSRFVVERLMEPNRASFLEFLELLKEGEPVDRAFDQAFPKFRWARADQGVWE